MMIQFTEAEWSEIHELEQRYEERITNALGRIKPFTGGYPGDDLVEQYQNYLEDLDDDSKKARQEYIDALEELTRERAKLFLKFAPDVFGGIGSEEELIEAVNNINYPSKYITPIDKLSNKAFEGVLNSANPVGVEVIKKAKSRNPIYNFVTINFEDLPGVQFAGRKELTPFDREVHDAIVTLYVEGGNKYITVNMIYQMMTGKRGSHCSPILAEEISKSITKMMVSRAIITVNDATIRGLKECNYDSNILNVKRCRVTINGQSVEAVKILDAPILYEYAKKRNQIGRHDVSLLDSPINKNKEVITLDGYLRRRILGMKGKSKLSPIIKYDTVYKHLGIMDGNDTATRKKRERVRKTIKRLLDFYIKDTFIRGYSEKIQVSGKGKIDSISIRA